MTHVPDLCLLWTDADVDDEVYTPVHTPTGPNSRPCPTCGSAARPDTRVTTTSGVLCTARNWKGEVCSTLVSLPDFVAVGTGVCTDVVDTACSESSIKERLSSLLHGVQPCESALRSASRIVASHMGRRPLPAKTVSDAVLLAAVNVMSAKQAPISTERHPRSRSRSRSRSMERRRGKGKGRSTSTTHDTEVADTLKDAVMRASLLGAKPMSRRTCHRLDRALYAPDPDASLSPTDRTRESLAVHAPALVSNFPTRVDAILSVLRQTPRVTRRLQTKTVAALVAAAIRLGLDSGAPVSAGLDERRVIEEIAAQFDVSTTNLWNTRTIIFDVVRRPVPTVSKASCSCKHE